MLVCGATNWIDGEVTYVGDQWQGDQVHDTTQRQRHPDFLLEQTREFLHNADGQHLHTDHLGVQSQQEEHEEEEERPERWDGKAGDGVWENDERQTDLWNDKQFFVILLELLFSQIFFW